MNNAVDQFDRLPPCDIDAERCVIGSLALCGDDRKTFELMRTALWPGCFYLADHAVMFAAICDLADAGRPVDAVMLRNELAKRGHLEECGGAGYIAEVLGRLPSSAHGPHYAAIVRRTAVLRGTIAAANEALRRCYEPSADPGAILSHISADLASLARTGVLDSFHRLDELCREVMGRKRDGDEMRIPTGLAELDDVIGGITRGRFTLIGGRPGSGKSLLGKQILLNVASGNGGRRPRLPVGLVTVEETRQKVAENALSNFSGIENNHIAYGTIGAEEWNEIDFAEGQLRKLDVWVSDLPVTLSEVEEAVTNAAMKHGCQVVVVDYLQLIDSEMRGETENREITRTSRVLKALAKRLDIAVVACCQLNRGNETGSIRLPSLRDLRGSGSLEQDGDCIILLHREDYYRYAEADFVPTHQLQAIIAKNKDGCVGTVPLHFSGRTQRITCWNGGRGEPYGELQDVAFAEDGEVV